MMSSLICMQFCFFSLIEKEQNHFVLCRILESGIGKRAHHMSIQLKLEACIVFSN